MERDDRPKELHTIADDEAPLSAREAGVMGSQRVRGAGTPLVYGDVGEGNENEDQADAHHAEPDEHL
ncbi:MAG: hypothetical protein NVSMB1_24820 [Polyangiales bacterium]